MKKTCLLFILLISTLLVKAQDDPAKSAAKPAVKKAAPSYAPSGKYDNSQFGPGHNRRRAKMRKRNRYI
jgi:hypothetical protein